MKSILFLFILMTVFPTILVADAGPPIERLPLTDITVSGVDGEPVVKLGEQAIIEVGYTVNYPNLEYVVLFLIADEDNKVVSLSWIEGFQDKLTDHPGSYICGNDICFDKHASLGSYICGNDICFDKHASLGSYICGNDICFDKHASLGSYICGNDICQNSNAYNSKLVQTSWHPYESGTYEITAFAWEGLDNPTAFSPPRSVEVTVIEKN